VSPAHHLHMCRSISHLQSKWTKVGNVLWWILAASVGVGLIIFYGVVWLYRRFAGPPLLLAFSVSPSRSLTSLCAVGFCNHHRNQRLSSDLRRLSSKRQVSRLRAWGKAKGY
jgi:hypothetical protein